MLQLQPSSLCMPFSLHTARLSRCCAGGDEGSPKEKHCSHNAGRLSDPPPHVLPPAVQIVKKGGGPLVQCSKEKHRGHTVTRIVGMEQFLVDPK